MLARRENGSQETNREAYPGGKSNHNVFLISFHSAPNPCSKAAVENRSLPSLALARISNSSFLSIRSAVYN